MFSGLDDMEGKTSIDGLYVAGDGMNCQGPTGAAYPTGVGFTSSFCSIQGDHAGKAAAAYAEKAAMNPITGDEIAEITEEILAPSASLLALIPTGPGTCWRASWRLTGCWSPRMKPICPPP